MSKGRGANRRLSSAAIAEGVYQPLPGFHERAPGIWIPEGYHPGKYELPGPVVQNPDEAATEYIKCARSLPHFVFNHCWSLHTDDPGGTPVYRKVPLYPYVADFLVRVQEPKNIHLEKSRQLLLSWLWMAVFLWDILFHDAWANLAISRKEVLVDDGAASATTDSLFGKLLVLWKALPPYLQHQMMFKHLRITCLATGSYVKGESGATSGGRGSTYKRALLDEAAFIGNSETLFRAVHEAAKKGLALNSTPMGKGNAFARIRFQPRTSFVRLSYHWAMHPEKNPGIYCNCGWRQDFTSTVGPREQYVAHVCTPPADPNEKVERKPRSPWYDAATADYTPEQIASEFDLSYEKSMRGRVFEPFDESRHVIDYLDALEMKRLGLKSVGVKPDAESPKKYRERYLRAMLKPGLTTLVGWDFGVGDPSSLCLGQVLDEPKMKIRWIDEYEMNDQSWRHYRKFINGLWGPLVREVTGQDLLHYCDPSGRNRDSNLMSWVANLGQEPAFGDPEGLGKKVVIVWTPAGGGVNPWCDFVADLIRRNGFEVSLWCALMIDALGQYHYPLDSNGEPVPGDHLPVHDKWSHSMSAMRYVYQIRWNSRLKDVFKAGPSAAAILLTGSGDKRDKPPMF